jgi:hypothetical protein
MCIGTRVSLVVVLASTGCAAIALAQGPYCKPLDNTGHHILYTVQRQATSPSDSAYRAKIWQIPLLAQSDVAFVTDENVCRQAATLCASGAGIW